MHKTPTNRYPPGRDVWVISERSSSLVHWNGTTCVNVDSALDAPHMGWGSSASDVWFAGRAANGRAGLSHWDGVVIGVDAIKSEGPELWAASGSGPSDMWFGGAGGALLRTTAPSGPASATH
jgi:hypothetical protein